PRLVKPLVGGVPTDPEVLGDLFDGLHLHVAAREDLVMQARELLRGFVDLPRSVGVPHDPAGSGSPRWEVGYRAGAVGVTPIQWNGRWLRRPSDIDDPVEDHDLEPQIELLLGRPSELLQALPDRGDDLLGDVGNRFHAALAGEEQFGDPLVDVSPKAGQELRHRAVVAGSRGNDKVHHRPPFSFRRIRREILTGNLEPHAGIPPSTRRGLTLQEGVTGGKWEEAGDRNSSRSTSQSTTPASRI